MAAFRFTEDPEGFARKLAQAIESGDASVIEQLMVERDRQLEDYLSRLVAVEEGTVESYDPGAGTAVVSSKGGTATVRVAWGLAELNPGETVFFDRARKALIGRIPAAPDAPGGCGPVLAGAASLVAELAHPPRGVVVFDTEGTYGDDVALYLGGDYYAENQVIRVEELGGAVADVAFKALSPEITYWNGHLYFAGRQYFEDDVVYGRHIWKLSTGPLRLTLVTLDDATFGDIPQENVLPTPAGGALWWAHKATNSSTWTLQRHDGSGIDTVPLPAGESGAPTALFGAASGHVWAIFGYERLYVRPGDAVSAWTEVEDFEDRFSDRACAPTGEFVEVEVRLGVSEIRSFATDGTMTTIPVDASELAAQPGTSGAAGPTVMYDASSGIVAGGAGKSSVSYVSGECVHLLWERSGLDPVWTWNAPWPWGLPGVVLYPSGDRIRWFVPAETEGHYEVWEATLSEP